MKVRISYNTSLTIVEILCTQQVLKYLYLSLSLFLSMSSVLKNLIGKTIITKFVQWWVYFWLQRDGLLVSITCLLQALHMMTMFISAIKQHDGMHCDSSLWMSPWSATIYKSKLANGNQCQYALTLRTVISVYSSLSFNNISIKFRRKSRKFSTLLQPRKQNQIAIFVP